MAEFLNILFLLNNNLMHFNILKFPIFLISLKFEKSLFLSNFISVIAGKFIFILHEHITFFTLLLYLVKSQFSSHTDRLFILYSSFLSFKDSSVPLSLVNV